MTSQDTPGVQVEVSIQDCFSQPADSELHRIETVLPSLETWATWFQAWLVTLKPDISAQAYELSLRLTNDQEIRSLNAQYRQTDQPTDVLAFAALEVDWPQPPDQTVPVYLGDIVISVDTALKQAETNQISLKRELAWLATHGLLHLLGWDHPDQGSLVQMLHQQDILLKAAGFPVKSESVSEFFTSSHVFK